MPLQAPAGNPPQEPELLQVICEDIDGLESSMQGWELDFRQLDAGPLSIRLTSIVSNRAVVARCFFNRRFHQLGKAPAGCRSLGVMGHGSPDLIWGHRRLDNNKIVAFDCADGFDGVTQQGHWGYPVSYPLDLLTEIGESMGIRGIDAALDPSTDTVTGDTAAIHELRKRLDLVFERASHCPGIVMTRAFHQELEFEIPALLLCAMDTTTARRTRPRMRLRDRAVKRALAIIEAHPDGSLHVGDLCKAVGVSWRTLDYAFKERFGIGPKRYLKNLRLDGARRELRGLGARTRIADVANRWGFWHLGQFARDYRQLFGRLPSESLP